MSIADKISSIKDTLGGGYIKPDINKVQQFIEGLRESTEAQVCRLVDYVKAKGFDKPKINPDRR